MPHRLSVPLATFVALVGAWCAIASAQARGEVPFTAEQASRGRAIYDRQCATCHGPDLDSR